LLAQCVGGVLDLANHFVPRRGLRNFLQLIDLLSQCLGSLLDLVDFFAAFGRIIRASSTTSIACGTGPSSCIALSSTEGPTAYGKTRTSSGRTHKSRDTGVRDNRHFALSAVSRGKLLFGLGRVIMDRTLVCNFWNAGILLRNVVDRCIPALSVQRHA